MHLKLEILIFSALIFLNNALLTHDFYVNNLPPVFHDQYLVYTNTMLD